MPQMSSNKGSLLKTCKARESKHFGAPKSNENGVKKTSKFRKNLSIGSLMKNTKYLKAKKINEIQKSCHTMSQRHMSQ